MISEPMARLTAVTVAVLTVAVFAVVALTSNPGLQGTSVEAEFEDAFPLLEGMNVRIDGAIAGTVRSIEVNEDGNADVVMQLNEGTRPPRADDLPPGRGGLGRRQRDGGEVQGGGYHGRAEEDWRGGYSDI